MTKFFMFLISCCIVPAALVWFISLLLGLVCVSGVSIKSGRRACFGPAAKGWRVS